MTTYNLYIDGELFTSTPDIVTHQKMIDRAHEAGILQHVTEERIKND